MSGLKIDKDTCIGCSACESACVAGAMSVKDGIAEADPDACTLCGICVQSCPVGAISLQRDDEGEAGAGNGVWVFCEVSEENLLPVSYELLGKGRELADASGTELTAVCIGGDVSKYEAALSAGPADTVMLCQAEHLERKDETVYCDVLAELILKRRPAILLFGATEFGRSLAPRLAARLGTGLTADCTELSVDPETGLLHQTRPAFGGNLMATIVTKNTRPQMVTARPGVFKAAAENRGKHASVEVMSPGRTESAVKLISSVKEEKGESIADAQIIVSVGRGLGAKKNMKLVYAVAEKLGAAVGVSRPLVDMGWCDYRHQIGQTGLSVAPKLLIACGISGAIQHLAGIGGAEKIIAINSDPDAQIFSVADVKIVGDCVEILREMLNALTEKEV